MFSDVHGVKLDAQFQSTSTIELREKTAPTKYLLLFKSKTNYLIRGTSTDVFVLMINPPAGTTEDPVFGDLLGYELWIISRK